jgi:hypothetical protein
MDHREADDIPQVLVDIAERLDAESAHASIRRSPRP